MKVNRIGEPKVILSNPEGLHNYFAWPTVARLQNGTVAVVCSGFRTAHIDPFGKAVISYSTDGGETYTLPAPVIDTLFDDRDAGILPFGETGVIVTSFNLSPEYWQRLAEGRFSKSHTSESEKDYILGYIGQVPKERWGEMRPRYRISSDGGVTFGPVLSSPVTSPHGPALLGDGSVLWVGRTYPDNKECSELQAYRVAPDGEMTYVGSIPNTIVLDGKVAVPMEPHVIRNDDGVLICLARVRTGIDPRYITLYQTESSDDGKTWTPYHAVLPADGGAPAHLIRHSSGVLIAAYGYRGVPSAVKVMFSRDGGYTWDTDHILYQTDPARYVHSGDEKKFDVSADLGYPATAELPDGTLLTVFYVRPDQHSPAVIMQQKWRLDAE